MLAVVFAYLVAVLVTYLCGAILATQVMLANVRGMGLSITLNDRFRATAHDLVGLADSYLPLLAAALLPGLFCGAVLARLLPRLRNVFYPVAGALSVVCLHLALREYSDIYGLAGTRDWHGLLLQGLAAWVGAYAYVICRGFVLR